MIARTPKMRKRRQDPWQVVLLECENLRLIDLKNSKAFLKLGCNLRPLALRGR